MLNRLLLVWHCIHWRWLPCRKVHLLLEHLRHLIELLLDGIHLLVIVWHVSHPRMLRQVRLRHVVDGVVILFVRVSSL